MVNLISFVSNGDCPTGWTEDTTFINRIPAFDSTVSNAMTTGGNSTSTHTHSVSIDNKGYHEGSGTTWVRGTPALVGGTTNLLPLHVKVKFCKKNARGITMPIGSLAMFDGDCPTGFSKVTAYDNRQPVGAISSLGTTGQTSGDHSHSIATINRDFAAWSYKWNGSSTSSDGFMASTALFSYVKVVLCRKL